LLIPLFQHQPSRPILPVLPHLLLLQHAEGFAWKVIAVHVFGIKDVAEFVAGEAIEPRIARVQFRAEVRAALIILAERLDVIAHIFRERLDVPRGLHQLQHARNSGQSRPAYNVKAASLLRADKS
jgi:hypothetical protein